MGDEILGAILGVLRGPWRADGAGPVDPEGLARRLGGVFAPLPVPGC
jgi:hypothetical protein